MAPQSCLVRELGRQIMFVKRAAQYWVVANWLWQIGLNWFVANLELYVNAELV